MIKDKFLFNSFPSWLSWVFITLLTQYRENYTSLYFQWWSTQEVQSWRLKIEVHKFCYKWLIYTGDNRLLSSNESKDFKLKSQVRSSKGRTFKSKFPIFSCFTRMKKECLILFFLYRYEVFIVVLYTKSL